MSKTRPSHKIYAVRKSGERNYWTEIGAAWPHGDGKGFNLKLEMIPLGDAEILIRKPRAAAEDQAATEA